MSGRIAVVGSNMVDLITYVTRMPDKGETIEAPNFALGCGGKGANQAIAAARLGADVLMVTRVGDDIFADNTIANFKANGIDTRFVRKVPGTPSGVAPIFVEQNGENSILILMQLEVPLETIYATVAFGAAHGIPTLLNPAPAVPELDVERLRTLSFLTPNETELAILSGMPVASETEVEAAARSLIAKGVRTVIVTMGARGALLVEEKGATRIAPVRVTPKDTTGAGDAFIGSFAHYYTQNGDIAAALRKAVRYAADSITRNGTQSSYATLAEFEAFCATIDA